MSRYLLAVDVGNSRLKIGLFPADDGGSEAALPHPAQTEVRPLEADLTRSKISAWLPAGAACVRGVVAGANPAGVQRVVDDWPQDECPVHILNAAGSLPLNVHVAEPDKVGIDRLLNSVAANVLRPAEAPAVIVDTGTATTVDAVSSQGAFLGGAILPGFELSALSLHRYTALLPLISVDELNGEPPAPLGTHTRDALRSGLFWGQLGAVKELVARLKETLQTAEDTTPDSLVLLTGGGAPLLAPHIPEARLEPHLSLQGLVLAARHALNEKQ